MTGCHCTVAVYAHIYISNKRLNSSAFQFSANNMMAARTCEAEVALVMP
jgi:hypothetical protein